jgi:hypothetical protein
MVKVRAKARSNYQNLTYSFPGTGPSQNCDAVTRDYYRRLGAVRFRNHFTVGKLCLPGLSACLIYAFPMKSLEAANG